MESVGSPWPRAEYGEVVGPNSARCFLVRTAAALAGMSDKTLRRRVKDHEGLATRAKIPGRQGPPALFIDAASFEALGRTEGWWPPPKRAIELATGSPNSLGSAAQERMAKLEAQVTALRLQLDDAQVERDELLKAIATLTRVARRRPRVER